MAIRGAKQLKQQASLILHFDFTENWTAIVSTEIKCYHWHKKQASVFTCVVTTRKTAHSYVFISDDMSHDAAHACFTLSKIHEFFEVPSQSHVTYVSDEAASHFKNKFKLYELLGKNHKSVKLLSYATGPGKNSCSRVGEVIKDQAFLHNLRAENRKVLQSASEMVA